MDDPTRYYSGNASSGPLPCAQKRSCKILKRPSLRAAYQEKTMGGC